jgi:thiamine biosynthesis protein ThiS
MKEVFVEETMAISDILDELQLSSAPVLIAVNGTIVDPDKKTAEKLKKGDKVMIISI